MVGYVVSGADDRGRFRVDCGVVFDGGAVGVLYCSEAGGHAGFAGGDGLAVASAVGVLWQLLARLLDLADVGLSVACVGGDGVHRDVGGGDIHDEADCMAPGIATCVGDDLGPSVSGQVGSSSP